MNLRRALLAALAFALALAPASAQQGIKVQIINQTFSAGPMGFLSSTQLGSAIGLPNVPTTARSAISAYICVEVAGVRYRDDGTAPTASVGVPLVPTSSTVPSCWWYYGPLSAVQFIAISGSPTMEIAYYYAN